MKEKSSPRIIEVGYRLTAYLDFVAWRLGGLAAWRLGGSIEA
jgi:hypothetical protein